MSALPFLKPVAVLGARKPHGTRLRYLGGCKCVPCRAASSRYECQRARMRKLGLSNGIIDAGAARRRLLQLSRMGIGRRAVARATGIAESVLQKIKSDKHRHCRAMTAKKILELGANSPGGASLTSGREVRRMIDHLLREGFTRGELARRLGFKTPHLQLNRERITRRNFDRVQSLYREVMAE